MAQGFAKTLFQLNQYDDWKHVVQGRLTLTSGTPVTTADVTGATTIYFTPYKGDNIALYDSTNSMWRSYKFTEISIAVPATTNTMYDIFIYDNGGTETLETLAWTNDTTRATALTTQDGVYVKTGDTTRRYLGSFRTTGVSGQTEDSISKRFLYNYYNKVDRKVYRTETAANWTYGSSVTRAANNNTANRIEIISGVQEDYIQLKVGITVTNGGTAFAAHIGVGVNSTTTMSGDLIPDWGENGTSGMTQWANADYKEIPRVGYSYYQWVENSRAGTTAFYNSVVGATAGILGTFKM